MNLRDLLEGVADGLEDVEASRAPDGTATWAAAGRPFAALSPDGSMAEFGLDSHVSAAATRTPDTRPSDRGPGWVLFSPKVRDGHAADRARAWFLSAYRGQRQHQE